MASEEMELPPSFKYVEGSGRVLVIGTASELERMVEEFTAMKAKAERCDLMEEFEDQEIRELRARVAELEAECRRHQRTIIAWEERHKEATDAN